MWELSSRKTGPEPGATICGGVAVGRQKRIKTHGEQVFAKALPSVGGDLGAKRRSLVSLRKDRALFKRQTRGDFGCVATAESCDAVVDASGEKSATPVGKESTEIARL